MCGYDGGVYCVVKWGKNPVNVLRISAIYLFPYDDVTRRGLQKIADFRAEKFNGIERNFLNFFLFFFHAVFVVVLTTVWCSKRVGFSPLSLQHDSWRGCSAYACHFCSTLDFRDLFAFNCGRKLNDCTKSNFTEPCTSHRRTLDVQWRDNCDGVFF